MQIKIRNPKNGQWITAPNTKSKKVFESLGSKIVADGRRILGDKKNTLKRDFNYGFKETKSAMELTFQFGSASDYWKFVDQGVRGTGGFKGSGGARGGGSPYSFKYDNPGGDLVTALESWIRSKSISLKDNMTLTQTAFAMGYSIKRRGLERTLFFTKALEKNVDKYMRLVTSAFADDVESVMNKIPKNIGEIKTNM